jgi:hypothetical protein
MNKTTILILIAVIIIVGAGFLVFKSPALAPGILVNEKQNVENYLRENISKLSPVKAVLGGTWYVVSDTVDLAKNSGTVIYEDGHIQEQRNFSYTLNGKGEVVSLTIANPVTPVACTLEAKRCPDGSYVSRTGPNCEFALCPNVSIPKSGITGMVTLSPTCPVERNPPDPNCAPKPYSTSISITKSGSTKIVKTIQSDAKGAFNADLDPGAYILQAQSGSVFPRCGEVSVVVKGGQYTNTGISCDTGIR